MSKNYPEVSTTPTKLEGAGSSSSSVACGWTHGAVVNTDGSLYTFGNNSEFQLGHECDGLGKVDLDGVKQVSLGGYHSAAVTKDGKLYTWGWGGSLWSGCGALGTGVKETHKLPVHIPLPAPVRQITAAKQHTIVVLEDGTLLSAGKGEFGRLGRGDTSDDPLFTIIDYFSHARDSILEPTGGVSAIKKAECGTHYSIALTEAGELFAWGRNDQGQLGLGEESMGDLYSTETYPRLIRSFPLEGTRIADFACGEHHVTALSTRGALYTWGDRAWLEPNRVSLPAEYENSIKCIKKVACGSKFSLALTEDGYLYTWGKKSSGCIFESSLAPVRVDPKLFGNEKIIDIAASKSRCMAITSSTEYQPEA